MAIADDPLEAGNLTARSNLVAVITNGTAVLGLGNIGPLAGKPVMEGKGCLFKKFAGIDVFDIELAENDPDALIDTIARMEPTFGGINLEDIKAPECFYIETKLRERMKIPVFHDDQHGTAIVAAAAILNALQARRQEHRARSSWWPRAPAPRRSPASTWSVSLGLQAREHLRQRRQGRGLPRPHRAAWTRTRRATRATPARARWPTIIRGADIFLGLSAGGVLKPEMVKAMARDPIILAMANPTPEIMPEEALAVRPDAVIGTGRSDYPNQVNNVLCFPFIFRGALDAGATTINEAMKLAAVRAIAELAHAEIPEVVAQAYGAVGPALRPRLPDPQALRSAPDRGGGAGRGAGRDGQRRGDAADRRHAGLSPAPVAVRLPVGQQHAAAVRGGQARAQARRLCRRRRRARAARRAGRRRRRPGAAAAARAAPR